MVMLISMEDAKEQVKTDTDDDDARLTRNVKAASRMILNYLKTIGKTYLPYDSSGELIVDSGGIVEDVPEEIQEATAYLTGMLYDDVDGAAIDSWEHGYLPKPVMSMIYPLRDPACA